MLKPLLGVNLGSKIESHVAHVFDRVLNHEWHLLTHVEGHDRRERRRLSKTVEVLKSKRELHGFLHLDDCPILSLIISRVLLANNVSGACRMCGRVWRGKLE